jgi:hypothetical protein
MFRPRSEGLLWMSKRFPPDHKQHSPQTNIHAAGPIQTPVPAGEEPQTHSLNRAATGIGTY